ncbi:hypothetical protein WOLCODRAFT_136899 [Wolfiporia cocos MD-104 SS10]|uniref:Prolyl 4-hydroxylase alpha subunit Fe(2+) 2OG dioxygenase domain-containing protein n=1 Tax=Wolfiporia cocos (strain MD-104) TaxID=742152 RepID=A0A2H3JE41_WOLCO|nr:hypothetical protein WOLCODRAFT_136899 [Wolfiporia cocos MD-104 SS10]
MAVINITEMPSQHIRRQLRLMSSGLTHLRATRATQWCNGSFLHTGREKQAKNTAVPDFTKQLESLRASITYQPPFCKGTLSVKDEDYILFYGKSKSGNARRIHLAKAASDELDHLESTCDAAPFGINNQNVLDETYRKAGKLDTSEFMTGFDPQRLGLLDTIRTDLFEGNERRNITAELYKLNVYGKNSFFKAHKDTPRAEDMFGSLVIAFPTAHEGGSFILLDSALMVADRTKPCVAYIAFYSDVEHEITPVKSGHRVTLTYNLYFTPDTAARRSGQIPRSDKQDTALAFKSTFQRLLDDPTFLPEGGKLGFNLRHEYPGRPDMDLQTLLGNLKGADAVIEEVCAELALPSSVKVIMETNAWGEQLTRIMLSKYPDIRGVQDVGGEGRELFEILREDYNGKLLDEVRSPFQEEYDEEDLENLEDGEEPEDLTAYPDLTVHWVTETPEPNRVEGAFICYGNEPMVDSAYANFCLVVEVEPAGKRQTTRRRRRRKPEGKKGNQPQSLIM